jgi:hypothetical protein
MVLMRRVLYAVAAVLVFASPARACDAVDDCLSSAGVSCPNMKVTVCPQGDFEMISKSCGATADYIWVEVITSCGGGGPLPGVPRTDFWFNACDPARQLALCIEPFIADSLTGMNGRTTFSGVLRAGGCVPSGGIWIAVQGFIIHTRWCASTLCLPIIVKSPDSTGPGGNPDGVVNLSDLIPFGFTYNKNLGQARYNPCCDYNDDDKCNLSDFAFFGTHYQHRCM